MGGVPDLLELSSHGLECRLVDVQIRARHTPGPNMAEETAETTRMIYCGNRDLTGNEQSWREGEMTITYKKKSLSNYVD